MSGYKPTTDEVREAYQEWAWSRRMWSSELEQEDGGEFDRWLAEVERAAAENAWGACMDEAAKQGTIHEPDNPYRREGTE